MYNKAIKGLSHIQFRMDRKEGNINVRDKS